MNPPPVYASFAIPIIDGEITLAKRNTPPHKGLYSAIGEKAEQLSTTYPNSQSPHQITRPGGRVDTCIGDKILANKNLENGATTALRGIVEELIPNPIVLGSARVGVVYDTYQGRQTNCTFYLTDLLGEIELSKRELSDVKRLRDLKAQEINEITRCALAEVFCIWKFWKDELKHTRYAHFAHLNLPDQFCGDWNANFNVEHSMVMLKGYIGEKRRTLSSNQ